MLLRFAADHRDLWNVPTSFAYDAASRLTSKSLPNGVAATYTYDDLDRLTRLKDAKNNTVIADNNYTYNTAGDITQNIDQSGTHTYAYDSLDRLTASTYTGTPNESYAYDGVGNRSSSHKSASYSYQPFNRLTGTSAATYLYNNNGNLISKSDASGTTQFAWDFENRLVQIVTPSAGSVSYKYDALGRRVQRVPSSGASTNFTYDGQDAVKDISSDGSTVEYLNGPGIDNKIRQKGSSNSTTYYFSQDHLGSTTALTGTTGKLVERITYDAYGNSAGSTRTRYGFTGRERDSLTGLLHYRARSYDPQIGRFISEDPIGFDGGVNWYIYAKDDPIKYKDPTGLKIWVCSRLAKSWEGWLGGNHSYLFDDRNRATCGLGGPRRSVYPFYGNTEPEKGPDEGATCRPVDGSDDPAKADQIMNCCRNFKSARYFPGLKDCHNLTNSCVTGAGLKDPGAPGGRLGERCIMCTQPVQPPPSSSSKCWGGARGY